MIRILLFLLSAPWIVIRCVIDDLENPGRLP
jgi:hypothetical protein